MKKCKYCKNDIDKNATVCPYCRKRQSYIKIILSIVITIVVTLLIVIWKNSINKIDSSTNNLMFKSEVSYFLVNYFDNCSELENIANDIKSYWYDSIVENKYNGDINVAIQQALQDNDSKVQNQKKNHISMQSSYNQIMKLKCHSYYCDEIKEKIKNAYETYDKFYELTIYPSGSLIAYSDNIIKIDSDGINYYNEIKDLRDSFNE